MMNVKIIILVKLYIVFYIKPTSCFQEETNKNITAKKDETVVNTKRPLIAILAMEATAYPEGESYIAASYVKLFESAGAQIIPIPGNIPEAKYLEILNSVNGVIFPGGQAKFNIPNYYKHLEIAYNKSIKATWEGDHFPIFGIDVGFRQIVLLLQSKLTTISDISLKDKSLPLIYSPLARESKMFGSLPNNLYEMLGNKSYAYHNYELSIDVKDFVTNPMTNRFFKILSTSKSPRGNEVVSSVEAFEFPIFGIQWHPETIPYEFSEDVHCNHDADNVEISFHIAAFFVDECRKNKQRFPTEEIVKDLLIYNHKPSYSALSKASIHVVEQIYVFD